MTPIQLDGFFCMENIYSKFLECSGISTDTRTIQENDLFFCLKGANFDGNKFASEAIEKGARYVVIDNATYTIEGKTLLVDDVLTTLQQLANFHRKQFSIPIIGITGSNGKTTTKELIAHLLSQSFRVLSTKGNLNNHIGVPMTLLRLRKEHQIAVIEMGANHPGDIKDLCVIAEPDYGIITTIGKAHLEGFINLDGVIQTKTALYRSVVQQRGTLFVNQDNPILIEHRPKDVAIEYYSAQGISSARINGQLMKLTPFIHLKWSSKDYDSEEIITQIIGEYNFYNLLAAITIADYFHVSPEKINNGIASYSNENNRSQVKKTEKNQLIMDAYNANPSSMTSAIDSFAKVVNPSKQMILGDMFELGKESKNEHLAIIQLVKDTAIPTYFVGNRFKECNIESKHLLFFETKELLTQHILSHPIEKKLILLKGSRGIALETLVDLL